MPAEISSNRFQTLPFEQASFQASLSGSSKRTGYLEDEYIISGGHCAALKSAKIHFGNLRSVDLLKHWVIEGLIRKMSSTYIFSL